MARATKGTIRTELKSPLHVPPKPNTKSGDRIVMLSPSGGEIFEAGATITALWRGGPANATTVRVALIHYPPGTNGYVLLDFPAAAYDPSAAFGTFSFKLPRELPIVHAHKYKVYVETNGTKTWAYGPEFQLS